MEKGHEEQRAYLCIYMCLDVHAVALDGHTGHQSRSLLVIRAECLGDRVGFHSVSFVSFPSNTVHLSYI